MARTVITPTSDRAATRVDTPPGTPQSEGMGVTAMRFIEAAAGRPAATAMTGGRALSWSRRPEVESAYLPWG